MLKEPQQQIKIINLQDQNSEISWYWNCSGLGLTISLDERIARTSRNYQSLKKSEKLKTESHINILCGPDFKTNISQNSQMLLGYAQSSYPLQLIFLHQKNLIQNFNQLHSKEEIISLLKIWKYSIFSGAINHLCSPCRASEYDHEIKRSD